MSNLLPVTLCIAIMNAPMSTAWIFFTLTIVTTLGDHSGYHMPFLHR
jgi:sterol desaturase/sphingolipid hydroxylase (fatty acid hydroxylase superfamily)